jgi:hypothetical protein
MRMTLDQFQSIVLSLSNQYLVRWYSWLNHPKEPRVMAIQFANMPMTAMREQLEGMGFTWDKAWQVWTIVRTDDRYRSCTACGGVIGVIAGADHLSDPGLCRGCVAKSCDPDVEEKPNDGRDGMPLRAEVEDGRLVISIGVETLAFAFEHGEGNNPFDEAANDFKREATIADPLEFAKDVCRAMNDEGEDGSTPLTRFLDSMMNEAVEQGSLGVADPDDPATEGDN